MSFRRYSIVEHPLVLFFLMSVAKYILERLAVSVQR
jgi:hypothetical protein